MARPEPTDAEWKQIDVIVKSLAETMGGDWRMYVTHAGAIIEALKEHAKTL